MQTEADHPPLEPQRQTTPSTSWTYDDVTEGLKSRGNKHFLQTEVISETMKLTQCFQFNYYYAPSQGTLKGISEL